MNLKRILLFRDQLSVLEELTDEQRGKLFYAISKFDTIDVDSLDQLTRIVFLPFKLSLERDLESYNNVVEKRVLAGKKSGEKRRNKNEHMFDCVEQTRTKTNQYKEKEKEEEKEYKEKNIKKESATHDIFPLKTKDNSLAGKSVFIPPSEEDCVSFFAEKKERDTEAKKFFAFYESKGWVVGKVRMKNWKSAASGWILRNKPAGINTSTPQGLAEYLIVNGETMFRELIRKKINKDGKSPQDWAKECWDMFWLAQHYLEDNKGFEQSIRKKHNI